MSEPSSAPSIHIRMLASVHEWATSDGNNVNLATGYRAIHQQRPVHLEEFIRILCHQRDVEGHTRLLDELFDQVHGKEAAGDATRAVPSLFEALGTKADMQRQIAEALADGRVDQYEARLLIAQIAKNRKREDELLADLAAIAEGVA